MNVHKITPHKSLLTWISGWDLCFACVLMAGGGILAIRDITSLPSQQEKVVFAGFSGERLILIGVALCLVLIFGGAAVGLFRSANRRTVWKDRFLTNSILPSLTYVSAGLGLACGWVCYFWPPTWLNEKMGAYLERLLPFTLWIGGGCLLCLLLLFFWDSQSQQDHGRVVISRKASYTLNTLLAAGLLLAIYFFPAAIGLAVRQEYLSVLIPLTLGITLAFGNDSRSGKVLAIVFSLFLFSLPLIGLWASGTSEPEILFGLFPNNDAAGYFYGAERVMNGSTLHEYSATRPLFSGYMAVLLSLWGGNLQAMIGTLVFFAALASTIAAREVQRNLGLAAGVLVWVLLFLFYRRFNGGTMTENLGLTLGAASFALIWRGAAQKNDLLILGGLFSLSVAWNARAGAIFVLPALGLWFAWQKQGWRRRGLALLASGTAIAAGFGMNAIVFQNLATAGAQPLSNFSFTLYGIASGGKGWGQYQFDHPEILLLPVNERAQAVYRVAFDLIRQNPLLFLQGMLSGWTNYFSTSWLGAYGFVGPRIEDASIASRLILFALAGSGFIGAFFKLKDTRYALTLFAMGGIILSVPFVPPIDADTRSYAATAAWMAVLPALGWLSIKECAGFEEIATQKKEWLPAHTTTILNGVLLLLVVVAPLMVKAFTPAIGWKEITCAPPLETVYVRLGQGSAITIQDDDQKERTFVPALRLAEFTQSIHNFHKTFLLDEFEQMTPPKTLVSSYNLKDGKPLMLILDSRAIVPGANILGVCGHYSNKPYTSNFFYGDYSKDATP